MKNLYNFKLKNPTAKFKLNGRDITAKNLTDDIAKAALEAGNNIFTFETKQDEKQASKKPTITTTGGGSTKGR